MSQSKPLKVKIKGIEDLPLHLLRQLDIPETVLKAMKISVVKGKDGNDGKNGTNGNKGAPGSKGAKGKNGTNGKAGTDGLPGKKGLPGTAGSNGKNGNKGDKGSNGAKGKNGAKGNPGRDGFHGKDAILNAETLQKAVTTIVKSIEPAVDPLVTIELGSDGHGNPAIIGTTAAGKKQIVNVPVFNPKAMMIRVKKYIDEGGGDFF